MTLVMLDVGSLTSNVNADAFDDVFLDEDPQDEPVERPIETLSAHELTKLLLESLDVGFVLATASGKILRANSIARQMLTAFGKESDVVPDALWKKLDPQLANAQAVPGRFTPSSPYISPARGRFFLRARALRAGGFVLSIAPAALREIDVSRVLSESFGLSAQEIRIAFFAAQGYRNREIAERLEIVEGTVKNYLTNVFSALSVRSRTELSTELAQLVEDQVTGSRSSR
jgi:DNA-binding CsgD family transcriptional regulator